VRSDLRLLDRDCLPPREKRQAFPRATWWIVTALVVFIALWTILG
jgi:hypothetical protein